MAGNRVVHADGDAFTSSGSNHAEAADLVLEHEDVPKDVASLLRVPNSELVIAKGVIATTTGMKFDKTLGLTDSGIIAERIGGIGAASRWWWVDWMEWTGFKWGAQYDVAARYMGCEPRRAEMIYFTGRKYDLKDRIEGVPFAYYEMALDKNLSRQESMGAIRKAIELGKPCTFVKEIVVQLLAQKGIETKKKSSAKNVAPEDPHKALDEQAAIIKKLEAEIEELKALVPGPADEECAVVYLYNDDYGCWVKLTDDWNTRHGTSLTVSNMIGGVGRAKCKEKGWIE